MTKISDEELERARLRLKRQVASMIILAMGETDGSFDDIDAKLQWEPGRTLQYIHSLISGSTTDLDTLSDLCLAMGVVPRVSLAYPEPTTPEPSQ